MWSSNKYIWYGNLFRRGWKWADRKHTLYRTITNEQIDVDSHSYFICRWHAGSNGDCTCYCIDYQLCQCKSRTRTSMSECVEYVWSMLFSSISVQPLFQYRIIYHKLILTKFVFFEINCWFLHVLFLLIMVRRCGKEKWNT